jgi:hypothetical protein
MVTAQLALGPMSSEIIEAVYQYSQFHRVQLMLIASKSQIDHAGGYVNNWTTRQYADYIAEMKVRYKDADVLVCRDHCGPGFNSAERREGKADLHDTLKTVETDLECGFDLVHVDLCFLREDHRTKLEWSREVIERVGSLKPGTLIEVGTDENTGEAELDLKKLSADVDFFLDFCAPEFYVAQTGSLTKEVNAAGTFDRGVTGQITDLLHAKGLKLKEHNADYLTYDEIGLRRGVVDAMNIAPMLGVLQTNFVLSECLKRGIDATEFLQRCYDSGKWKKWMWKNDAGNKYLCSLIAGHYNFSTPEYAKIFGRLEGSWIGVRNAIIGMMHEVIDRYLAGIQDRTRR